MKERREEIDGDPGDFVDSRPGVPPGRAGCPGDSAPGGRVLAETIQQAFPPFHVSDERPKMQEEEAAYEALHPTLLTQYRNQYVAIHQGVVVDHAPDEIELVERVHARYPDQVVLIRKVGLLPLELLQIRSPRWVKPV